MKGSFYLTYCAVVAALGGLFFGIDVAVMSGAESAIQEHWDLSGFAHGFTVAIALIGTVIGTFLIAKPADNYGRKKVLILIAMLFFIAAVGSSLSQHWGLFLIFRFMGGLGVGSAAVVGPMYIAEIAPAKQRGSLGALFQLTIVTGILVAFILNYLISLKVEQHAWRWMLATEAVPALLFFGLLFTLPGTPRWLIMKGKRDEAAAIYLRFGIQNFEEEIRQIDRSLHTDTDKAPKLLSRKYRLPILLAFLIAVFNQLSGINAIMYYTPRIFELAGFDRSTSLFQSISIGLTNMVFTIIAMFIIDKAGRKPLLKIGAVGTTLALGFVGYAFLNGIGGPFVVVGLIGYIAFFALSQGAVIWVYISEIFPTNVRAKGQTLGNGTHWVLAVLVSWIFPLIVGDRASNIGFAFLFFAAITFFQMVAVSYWFVETKGRSLEELQKDLLEA